MKILYVCAILSLFAQPVRAQLISPGKLSDAHTSLEGISNCVNCHRLGKRGIDDQKCLDCHTPIASRIDNASGYHGRLTNGSCSTCHKEHFGRGFDVLRLDTLAFEHTDTGFELIASHERTACRGCHVPDNIVDNEVLQFKGANGAVHRTWLGLTTSCRLCHRSDSPHVDQFGTDECSTCHDENVWEAAPRFDHSTTEFVLTGRHVSVSCEGCHRATSQASSSAEVVYADADGRSCQSCHEDTHDGAFGSSCSTCHSTADWQAIDAARLTSVFDHSRTGFDLVGAHRSASCSSCHTASPTATIRIVHADTRGDRNFPRPVVEDCASCHVDYHEGVFEASGANCAGCHTETGWLPGIYDVDRHNREASFELTGAHLATPCYACHLGSQGQRAHTFEFADQSCEACHTSDSPHDGEFAGSDGQTLCDSCHGTDSWSSLSAFDHDQTSFALTGRHAVAACSSCHTATLDDPSASFALVESTCVSCHAAEDPHAAQFAERQCSDCHDTGSFRISTEVSPFDHESTRFSLLGAHEQVSCSSCHVLEKGRDGRYFTRFRPIDTACKGCHVAER